MLLSGGIDSATCLYLVKGKYSVRALTFEYHGIADRELESAKALAKAGEVKEHRVVRLPDLREARDIGGGKFPGLPPTYIPMRNSVFYSLAASYAEETRADFIVGGHNKEDKKVFRDADPRFFREFEKVLWTGSRILNSRRTRVILPVGAKTKAQVVRLAVSKGVPLEMTWSCHRYGSEHCWKCEGCLGRMEAFRKAGEPDPLLRVARPA